MDAAAPEAAAPGSTAPGGQPAQPSLDEAERRLLQLL